MIPYVRILVALFSTASIGLAQAPHAAIVTGEVHNPRRGIARSTTNPYSLPDRPNTTSSWTGKIALLCS